MLDAGLTATLKIISFPFVRPPLIPPAPFLRVLPFEDTMGSLCSLPNILDAENPSPNSIPLTPGMENARCEMTDSPESKKGAPIPA